MELVEAMTMKILISRLLGAASFFVLPLVSADFTSGEASLSLGSVRASNRLMRFSVIRLAVIVQYLAFIIWAPISGCVGQTARPIASDLLEIERVCEEGSGPLTVTHRGETKTFNLNTTDEVDVMADWCTDLQGETFSACIKGRDIYTYRKKWQCRNSVSHELCHGFGYERAICDGPFLVGGR
jgi:hypothetical protein